MTKLNAVVLAVSIAVSGSASASFFGGNDGNDNRNTNTNINAPSQNQGQTQSQLQGQAQSSYNRNNNSATGVGIADSNSSSLSGSVSGAYSDGSNAKSGSSSDNSVSISHEYNEADDIRIKNTPNVGAASLTTSNGTCMGSSSVGGSGPGVGVSFGTTWTDSGCTHRYNAEMMFNLGYGDVAVKIMCREESVAESAPSLCGVADKIVESAAENGFF